MNKSYQLLLFTCMLILFGCDQGEEQQPAKLPEQKPAPQAVEQKSAIKQKAVKEQRSIVVATVNAEDITQDQVQHAIERSFASVDTALIDETVKGNIIESIIATKALAQRMRSQLTAQQLSRIEYLAQAYAEELLVKEYLLQHAQPKPVSTAMIKDYYATHLEDYGGGETRVVEILNTAGPADESTVQRVLQALKKIQQHDDWVQANFDTELGLQYSKTKLQPGLLHSSIELAASQLQPGKVSDVIFIDAAPHILRVLDILQLTPKPLSEVSNEIRKILAAQQLKQAIRDATQKVLAEVAVKRYYKNKDWKNKQ